MAILKDPTKLFAGGDQSETLSLTTNGQAKGWILNGSSTEMESQQEDYFGGFDDCIFVEQNIQCLNLCTSSPL